MPRGNWPVLRVAVPRPLFAQVIERARFEGKPVSKFCREVIAAWINPLLETGAEVAVNGQKVPDDISESELIRDAIREHLTTAREGMWDRDLSTSVTVLLGLPVDRDLVGPELEAMLKAGVLVERRVIHGTEPRRMILLAGEMS